MAGWSRVRRNRVLLAAAGIGLVVAALWAARRALFPYIVALVLAYVMAPAVDRLQHLLRHRLIKRDRVARPIAILLVYALSIGLVALFISLVVPVLVQQFDALWASRFELGSRLQDLTNQSLEWYRKSVPAAVQTQVDAALSRASGTLASAVQAGLAATLSLVTSTVSFVLGVAIVPFWVFYVLYDRDRMKEAVHDAIPASLWPDCRNLFRIVDKVLGAYVRGQMILSLAIGLMAAIGLTILGVESPWVLGVTAGLFEFLPFIGPILGAVPAVIVATVQQPILGLWTVLLFLGIQQIENVLLAPRITGDAVELHPAIIMVVLVVGNELAGLWGMLIVVPLTAILRNLYVYLHLRFQDEPVPAEEALERAMRRRGPASLQGELGGQPVA